MFSKGIATKGGDVFRDEKSLAFDGSNEYVQLGSAFNYNVHSISAWVKFNADTTHKFIFDARDANDDGIMFFITSAEKIMYSINAVDGVYDSVLTEGVWYHLVGTNDGTTSRIYLNGVEVETADTSGTTINTTTPGTIATQSFSTPGHLFNGNISEVVFYTSALTANQVKTIYNGREPYNHKEGVASGNLQAWYRMGDGIIDRIGKNAHTNTGAIADMSNYTLGTDVLGGKGDFSDASYWTITSGQSIVESNVGKFLGNGSYGVIQKSSVLTANKIYLAKVTCSANAGAPVHFNFGDPFPQIIPDNETGEFSICFVAGNTNVILYATTYNEAVTIDNLTIQEVGGNAGAMINMAVDDFEGDTP